MKQRLQLKTWQKNKTQWRIKLSRKNKALKKIENLFQEQFLTIKSLFESSDLISNPISIKGFFLSTLPISQENKGYLSEKT